MELTQALDEELKKMCEVFAKLSPEVSLAVILQLLVEVRVHPEMETSDA